MKGLDMVDLKILELLQQDARMTLKEIGSRVYLTSPAVSARIEKLEKSGVIEGYHAKINPDAFKLQTKAFVNLKMDPAQKREQVYEYVRSVRNVIQCDCMTGDYVILLEVIFHDTQELEHFVDHLKQYGETRTQIVFSSEVNHRELPVAAKKSA